MCQSGPDVAAYPELLPPTLGEHVEQNVSLATSSGTRFQLRGEIRCQFIILTRKDELLLLRKSALGRPLRRNSGVRASFRGIPVSNSGVRASFRAGEIRCQGKIRCQFISLARKDELIPNSDFKAGW